MIESIFLSLHEFTSIDSNRHRRSFHRLLSLNFVSRDFSLPSYDRSSCRGLDRSPRTRERSSQRTTFTLCIVSSIFFGSNCRNQFNHYYVTLSYIKNNSNLFINPREGTSIDSYWSKRWFWSARKAKNNHIPLTFFHFNIWMTSSLIWHF